MNKNQIIKVDEESKDFRLDIYIASIFDSISRSLIQKNIKNGNILVNKKLSKASYILKEKDEIEIVNIEIPLINIEPENIKLDIRYEDEDMLVVNKPKNMLTHPTYKEKNNTLVNALLYRYGKEGLSDINGEFRSGIVHRLDRNTSGLLMVAKNNQAHIHLANQIRTKTARRKYLAIVEGVVKEDKGVIETYIGRDPIHKEKMAVLKDEGKYSITEYKVIERFKANTYIKLELKTGRTHQIRVHMRHIGHRIVNDSLYGARRISVKTMEQVLQANELKFYPLNKEEYVNIKIEEDNDIKKVLNYLRSNKI